MRAATVWVPQLQFSFEQHCAVKGLWLLIGLILIGCGRILILFDNCLHIPANGLYFLSYELLTDEYKRRYNRPNVDLIPAIIAGGLAGICYWIGGMPADVLKSRLQTAPEGTFSGIRDVLKDLLKNDGPAALYRGFTPVILRAFPANAATFFGIELANTFFRYVAPNF